MKHSLIPVLAAFGFLPMASQAALIATENFNYANGSIADLSGGTGWTREGVDEPGAPTQSPSDWDIHFGNHQISSNTLVTNGGGVKREFGGASEGTGTSNEREGAFRAEGTMFFSVSMNVTAMLPEGQNQWAGGSSFDFGEERIFFGLPGQSGSTRFFGIAAPGFGADSLSTIAINPGVSYTLVGMVDFENDLLGLWVNPDGSDTVASFDVSKAYNASNWSTALRLGSGTEVTWDDLKVGTSFSDVVPEPSSALLSVMAAGACFARRRRC